MSKGLRIGVVLPPTGGVGTGNMRTAQRWLGFFCELGHEARIFAQEEPFDCDVLVALNAVKSAAAISRFRKENREGKLVVVVTGTDLNRRESREWKHSLRVADRVVVLQNKALEAVREEASGKVETIVQSVEVPSGLLSRGSNKCFQICVVGHLRAEKDPLLTARAVRTLGDDSRAQVLQAGAILEEKYHQEVMAERQLNARYQWLGELSQQESLALIARSDLMVLSSVSEGGPGVIGEAVSLGTPILSTRIDGVVGLLGEGFPGYFEPGDVMGLARLIGRSERDCSFYQELQDAVLARQEQFNPARERACWEGLLARL